MATLTLTQRQYLVRMMDARYAREQQEIDTIEARLLQERLQESAAASAADRLDAGTADTAFATDYAMIRQNMQDMRDIEAARRRLRAGTYGTCVECGEAIGFERLRAFPTAKRCIACQRLHEQ